MTAIVFDSLPGICYRSVLGLPRMLPAPDTESVISPTSSDVFYREMKFQDYHLCFGMFIVTGVFIDLDLFNK